MELINNNTYPFGRAAASQANSKINTARDTTGGTGNASMQMEGEDELGAVTSPIELLAEFEALDVNKMIDNYVIPNVNYTTGEHLTVSKEMREFLVGMMHYEGNDRVTAL